LEQPLEQRAVEQPVRCRECDGRRNGGSGGAEDPEEEWRQRLRMRRRGQGRRGEAVVAGATEGERKMKVKFFLDDTAGVDPPT
jgi:hypothetical protein